MTRLACCYRKDRRRPRIQTQLLVCKARALLPTVSPHLPPPLTRPGLWSFSCHPISRSSPVPRVLSFRGPRERHGLSTGREAKRSHHSLSPTCSSSHVWKHLGHPTLRRTRLHVSSAFHQLLAGLWDLALVPSTSLEKLSCLKPGYRKEPSLPVWLGHQHLALTSDTKPGRQPEPPGGQWGGWGEQEGKEDRAPSWTLQTPISHRPKAPASAAGTTHPRTWAESGPRQRWRQPHAAAVDSCGTQLRALTVSPTHTSPVHSQECRGSLPQTAARPEGSEAGRRRGG